MLTSAPKSAPHLAPKSVPPTPEAPPRVAAPIDWEAESPQGFYPRYGHRLLDLALLVIALPLTVLPGLAIAVVNTCVFRDPRKILFVQQRVGYRGRVFSIYKFRTMRELAHGHMNSWSQGHDTLRVTRFGRFLRNAHLDELPQLLNVLLGDMSFIGPRPEMVEIEAWANLHVPDFTRRLAVRPGISGYAQITQGYTGCDERAYAEKYAINEHYLRTISFATDLEIVARTILWMLRGKGWDWQPKVQPNAASRTDGGIRAASGKEHALPTPTRKTAA